MHKTSQANGWKCANIMGTLPTTINLSQLLPGGLAFWLHGALIALCELYQGLGIDLGDLRQATAADKSEMAGQIVIAPPGALNDRWARRLPNPLIVGASGWMRVRQRAKQRGVELALVVSDHADWNELQTTIRDVQAGEIWVTHGAEDALIHWCREQGLTAHALRLVGRGEEEQ